MRSDGRSEDFYIKVRYSQPRLCQHMVNAYRFYMDESGTRHPDRDPGRKPAHGHDWFGLGGILIRESDEESLRAAHATFCKKWRITAPLRSADIRSKSGAFAWLKVCGAEKGEAFLEELYQLMARPELLGIACVIDRPGYNQKYRERYGRQRWSLCKTAFAVAIERAAKHVRKQGHQLRVLVERSDKKTDRWMHYYYQDLRSNGAPFDKTTSGKYQPLSPSELRETLYEFRLKGKSSPPMQIADLYLWPICIGGYDSSNRPYRRLLEDGRLIDCVLPAELIAAEGTKYSCFELVAREKH